MNHGLYWSYTQWRESINWVEFGKQLEMVEIEINNLRHFLIFMIVSTIIHLNIVKGWCLIVLWVIQVKTYICGEITKFSCFSFGDSMESYPTDFYSYIFYIIHTFPHTLITLK